MEILLIIFAIVLTTSAEDAFVNCDYTLRNSKYTCEASFNNLNNFNDFAVIGGVHLENYTNDDVISIYDYARGKTTNIPTILCNTFPNVEDVYLTDIGVTRIDDETFVGCSKMNSLSIQRNYINSISINAFVTLLNLTYIELSYNLLSANVFASQGKLQTIESLFQPLINLKELYLNHVELTSIDPWLTGGVSKNLETLELTQNRLTDIPTGAFIKFQKLLTLNLQQNEICSISRGAFAGLLNLQELILQGNYISELPVGIFGYLRSLLHLDLENNLIMSISPSTFAGMIKLEYLSLRMNRIENIAVRGFAGLPILESLDMRGNVCADNQFTAFDQNRGEYMQALETCFKNA